MGARQRPGWRVRVGLAWITAVLLAYYLVHPPLSGALFAQVFAPADHLEVDGQVLLRFGAHLLDVFLACWLLLVGAALGQVIWRGGGLPAVEGVLRVALGTGLGLGALSLASFVLGMLGWLAAWVLWGGLTLLSLVCWRQGWWVLGWIGGEARQIPGALRAGSLLSRCLWCFVLGTFGLLVLAALLPATAWDALMYHLAAPARDLAQGRVLPDVSNFQGYQPQLVEMLNLDGLLLHGDGVAALLQVGFGWLCVLTLVALVRQMCDGPRMTGVSGGGTLALRTVAIFLSIPSLVLVLGWAYVDGALVYYELAALCALLCWWNAVARLRLRWLLLTGALAGLALDVKYTGGFALVALALLVAWRCWQMGGMGRVLWEVAGLSAAALLVGSPWLLRNLVLTGDPFFPYHLGHVFAAGPLWDDGRTWHAVEGPGWGWVQAWRVLTLPLEVTIFGTQGSVEFDATLGPLLLLLLPLGLLLGSGKAPEEAGAKASGFSGKLGDSGCGDEAGQVGREGGEGAVVGVRADGVGWMERQAVGVLLAFAAIEGLCWAVELLSVHFARQSRLFFPLFAALALPAAVVWLRLKVSAAPIPAAVPRPAARSPVAPVTSVLRPAAPVLYRLATGAVVLALGCGLLAQMANTLGDGNLPYLLGLQSREGYLLDHLDPYYSAMQAVNALPASARVLFLWEVRSYYVLRAVSADPFLDNFDYYYRHCPGPEQMLRCFKEAGFTHVLLYAQGVQLILEGRPGDLSAQELAALEGLLGRLSTPYYADAMPLLKSGQSVPPDAEQVLGQRGWYRLYALLGV